MCFKNFIVLSTLIISINSKSYINPQNSDDIISEEEAESWRNFAANDVHKLTFTKICQELGVSSLGVSNKTHRRFKRFYSTEEFTGHLQDLFKYACFNGDLLSCGVTLARILPYRFYINTNNVIDKVLGKAGPSESRKVTLKLIAKKINLIETQIRHHNEFRKMEDSYSENKKNLLQLQLLHVYTTLCQHYQNQEAESTDDIQD